jgi:hypothetical protein
VGSEADRIPWYLGAANRGDENRRPHQRAKEDLLEACLHDLVLWCRFARRQMNRNQRLRNRSMEINTEHKNSFRMQVREV